VSGKIQSCFLQWRLSEKTRALTCTKTRGDHFSLVRRQASLWLWATALRRSAVLQPGQRRTADGTGNCLANYCAGTAFKTKH